jgi:hypothetical protein
MWKLIGLSHLSSNEQYLLLLLAICGSCAVGWAMDLIMGRVGFGIFGNAGVSMLGIGVGLWTYNNYYGRMSSPDVPVVFAFIVVSIMLHLVVLSVLRRVLRL